MLAVAGDDAERGLEALRVHWAGLLPDEADPTWDPTDGVIDLEADRARCPACGEDFTLDRSHCPGCGLRLR